MQGGPGQAGRGQSLVLRMKVNVVIHGCSHEDILESRIRHKSVFPSLLPPDLRPAEAVFVVSVGAELDEAKGESEVCPTFCCLVPSLSPGRDQVLKQTIIDLHVVARVGLALVPECSSEGQLGQRLDHPIPEIVVVIVFTIKTLISHVTGIQNLGRRPGLDDGAPPGGVYEAHRDSVAPQGPHLVLDLLREEQADGGEGSRARPPQAGPTGR